MISILFFQLYIHRIQGSELYLNWIAGAGVTHDVFFTDSRVIASYRESPRILFLDRINPILRNRTLCEDDCQQIQELL